MRSGYGYLLMRISLVSIGAKRGRGKREAEDSLVDCYLRRSGRYVSIEGVWVETEAAFWGVIDNTAGRMAARSILMDGGGRMMTSVEFAGAIADCRDRGVQSIVVGIGGADGWTADAKSRADLVVSMGRFTLPHSLARVVAAEQIYRAMTILAGHPYHCGH